MKFKINGVSNPKIVLSLKKLTNSFFVENQFVETDPDYSVSFDGDSNHITLTCNSLHLQKTNEANNEKYTILTLYYEFLHHITGKTLPWGVLSGIRPTKLAHRYLKANVRPNDVVDLLKSKYVLSEQKARMLVEIASLQRRVITDFDQLYKKISIYINIPFCLSRCTYCSFTSYQLNYRFVSIDDYLEKLLYEIDATAKFIQANQIEVTSIYIGGGTPTALNNEQLKRLLDKIETSFNLKELLEYTLECGRPDTLSQSKLELISSYSVTRISINPQTFNQKTLDRVNRKHSLEEVSEIFTLARRFHFNNINMDLIMGLPNETVLDAKHSVESTLNLAPESITVHTLAYKRGSSLFHEEHEANQEIEKMFNLSVELIKEAGYSAYYLYRQKNIVGNLENIGFAKIGYESIYNIIMIEELQNIIGLGCGASSKFLNHELILNPKDLISYVKTYKEYLDRKLSQLKENFVKKEDEEIDE